MKEDIWYANIRAFFDRDTLINFFPSEDMSFEEKLNSFFRFCIYFSILIFLFKKSYNVFYIAFFGGVITYILNEIQTYKNEDEKYTNDISGDVNDQYSKKKCSVPSKMNPFMNVLVTDYNHNPKRPVACDISKKDVKQKMEKYFDTDLYKSIDDVFNKNSSYRQFYTTPSTTIPNDQEAFAKWLYYKEGKTCKEGNTSKCYYV